MEIVIIIGAIQALFFAVLVLNKKKKSPKDNVLGFWLLTMFLNLACPYIAFLYPDKYYSLAELGAFLFPMLSIWSFVYTKTITIGKFKIKWLLHFLSLLVVGSAFIPLILSNENFQSLNTQNDFNSLLIIAALTNLIVFTVYSIASIVVLRMHKRKIRFEFSYEKNIDLKWLQYLISSLLIISFLFIAFLVLFFSNQLQIIQVDLYLYSIVSVFIFFIGFWGFKQGTIFHYNTAEVKTRINEEDKVRIEQSKSEDEQLAEELHNHMLIKQPYLNPQLSLYDLSSSMKISSQNLSSHLNKFRKINFYEYVNQYRIQEVKRRLKDDNQKFTILSIAYDCGFNSKASFNRIFKQTTGSTPSEYIKEHSNN